MVTACGWRELNIVNAIFGFGHSEYSHYTMSTFGDVAFREDNGPVFVESGCGAPANPVVSFERKPGAGDAESYPGADSP